ncbi:IS5 family transposase [Streptomyces europaeiscabiei]|uniref:IS5 family transposase n=1 Tax=Streptomyces europaeiscabiei TaxID=146819 RepID=UPI0038F67DC6
MGSWRFSRAHWRAVAVPLGVVSGTGCWVHDRHRRWSADGTWERILRVVQADADAEGRIDWSMVSVDSTTCRAHQHAAGASTRAPKIPGRRRGPARHRPDEALGRSRGGLTSKIHLAGEGGCRPLGSVITPGQWGDAPQMIPVLEEIRVPRQAGGRPRTRPGHVGETRRTQHAVIGVTCADARSNTRSPSRETSGPTAGAAAAKEVGPQASTRRSTGRRNEVERTINRLKNFRAVATRFDKRAYVFHGTVTVAAIRLGLRPQ